MFISIGVDCGVTFYLKEKNVRNVALPFDWVVTFKGVTDLIKNNFKKFGEHTLMPHHVFPRDLEKYIRRMKRFNELLRSENDELVFLRKGHAEYHHTESSCIVCDIEDSKNLETHLSEKYPYLKYKIKTFLLCSKCYDLDKHYESTNHLEIHTIPHEETDSHHVIYDYFKKYCDKLL